MRGVVLVAGVLALVVNFCHTLERRAEAWAGQASLAGVWEGTIDVSGLSLRMRVVFTQAAEAWSGTIDIPQQGASGIPLREVRLAGSNVHFELPTGAAAAVFDGEVSGTGITGSFTQGPAVGTFQLTRVADVPTPAPPPYREEDVTFANGSVTLAGTLTIPEGDGPFPAVVLLTGSGAQTRDEEIFGFKVFREMADHLTRNGIAVLRYDDRGIGGSTGTIAQSTTEDFARDARAAMALLRARSDIRAANIGLLGHSEGATVAALAATATEAAPSFVVMLAGAGVAGDRVTRQQVTDGARLMGATDEQVSRIVEAHRHMTELISRGAGRSEVTEAVRALMRAQLEGRPAEQVAAIGDIDTFIEGRLNAEVTRVMTPWWRHFVSFDPATALEKVNCPVLVLFGGKDVQVPPSLHRTPIEAALANNPRVKVVEFPAANHLFQEAITGQVAEYQVLEKAFVPGLLDEITGWIREVTADR